MFEVESMRSGSWFASILIMSLGLLVVASSVPVNSGLSEGTSHEHTHSNFNTLKGEDFTHSVMMELFVTTYCDRCPTAEKASTELNIEYHESFHFVSMVCDVNDDADARSEDYLVETYPTAVFDGGDEDDRDSENDTSGEKDKERYEEHVENCGSRDVSATPVELTVELTDQGEGRIDVSYSATFTGTSQWFDCHIRVYVTEQLSRYDNLEGDPIPYGFLGYGFDEDIRLYPQLEQTDSTTYDTDGGEFENIVVIAAIFDKRTGVERYVVQTASTEEYGDITFTDIEHSPETPKHDQKVEVSCNAVGDIASIYVEVAPCTESSCMVPEDVPMENVEGNLYEADIGSFDDDIVSVHYKIVAEDSGGQRSRSATYDFEFDDSGSNEDSSKVLMYGGGAVVILGVVLGAVLITRNQSKVKAGKDDEVW